MHLVHRCTSFTYGSNVKKFTSLFDANFAEKQFLHKNFADAATSRCMKPVSSICHNYVCCISYKSGLKYIHGLSSSLFAARNAFTSGTRKYSTSTTNSSALAVEELMNEICKKNKKYVSLQCSSDEDEWAQRRAFLQYIRHSLVLENITEDNEMIKLQKASKFGEKIKLTDMSVEKIQEIHSIIIDDGGNIRTNVIGVRHPITGAVVKVSRPNNIAEKLQTILSSITARNNRLPPLIIALQFKLSIVNIHPFRDGNGRLSRLLFNWILRRHGFNIWVSFPANEVNQYYNAVGAANEWKFYEYALSCVDRSYSCLLNDVSSLKSSKIKL